MSTKPGAIRARHVGVNDRGMVVGQDHHRSKLSDHEVDLMRDLRAEGMKLSDIAFKFECSMATASYVCSHQRRSHTATGQRLRGTPRFRFRSASLSEFTYVSDDGAD